MPSRIFRSSISPFHDTLSSVCDLLFSALGFLLQLLVEPRFQNAFFCCVQERLPSQRGVPCISDEPVSVALLNCENLSLVDLLCSSFDACCWPCSSLPAVGHALLTLTLRIGLRVSSALVACCHATALLLVSFVCIFGRSSRLQCQLFVPVALLVVLLSLRVSSTSSK